MKSSGKLSADAIVCTGPCRLLGVTLTANTIKYVTITVYPDTSATGTEVAFGGASGGNVASGVEGGTHNFVIKFSRDDNMFCDNGLYAKLSSAVGDYVVYYEKM